MQVFEICWEREPTMGRIDAGKSGGPASRRLRWAQLGTVVALAMVLVVGLGVSGCAFTFGGKTTTTGSPGSAVTSSTSSTAGSNSTTLNTGGGTIVTAADGLASPAETVGTLLGPSVVNIDVKGTAASQGPFGGQGAYEVQGSGVIYTADGMIITNNHVVAPYGDPSSAITVTLTTGEKLKATIVGRDELTDLAVIKITPDGKLPPATFVTKLPKVGEYTIAIGSPEGFANSVTLGIVSALDRSLDVQTETGGVVTYAGLIQTDAPISPGNSGGALANSNGQVVGINAVKSTDLGAEGIGFAIPASLVTSVADQIISSGKATHAYLGVATQTVTADLQKQYHLSRSSGVEVGSVTANGPAAKAGLKIGDIIIKIDGKDTLESSDVLISVRDKKPGDTVQIVFDRGGKQMTVTVTLEERPANLS